MGINLILVGAPGSGKGTQAKFLVENYSLVHISTGEMFRHEIRTRTELGIVADRFISEGNFVPDEITCKMLRERLNLPENESGVILDGFPRNLDQAAALEKMFSAANFSLDKVLYIKVPNKELVKRLASRRVCSRCGATYNILAEPDLSACKLDGAPLEHRTDDQPEAIQTRLEVYAQKTAPLLDFYDKQGKLCVINGLGAPEAVFERLRAYF